MGLYLTRIGTILVPSWIPLGSLMGPLWAHLGTILVPSWIHLGSLMGPLWTHLGTILVPSWIHLGSLVGPLWTHPGTILVPSWIHLGSPRQKLHGQVRASFGDPAAWRNEQEAACSEGGDSNDSKVESIAPPFCLYFSQNWLYPLQVCARFRHLGPSWLPLISLLDH